MRPCDVPFAARGDGARAWTALREASYVSQSRSYPRLAYDTQRDLRECDIAAMLTRRRRPPESRDSCRRALPQPPGRPFSLATDEELRSRAGPPRYITLIFSLRRYERVVRVPAAETSYIRVLRAGLCHACVAPMILINVLRRRSRASFLRSFAGSTAEYGLACLANEFGNAPASGQRGRASLSKFPPSCSRQSCAIANAKPRFYGHLPLGPVRAGPRWASRPEARRQGAIAVPQAVCLWGRPRQPRNSELPGRRPAYGSKDCWIGSGRTPLSHDSGSRRSVSSRPKHQDHAGNPRCARARGGRTTPLCSRVSSELSVRHGALDYAT